MKTKIIIGLIVLGLIAFFSSAYVVDETEQVVITQFGKAIGKPKTEPGLYFKLPIVQHANYFPKNLLEWDGDPGQIPTLDKTYIWVDTFARWKIVDPLKFFQTVNNVVGAQARLDDILDAAVRNLITSYPLIETVRKSSRKLDTLESGFGTSEKYEILTNVQLGRAKIMEEIKKQAEPKVEAFGISLVDVKIKRVNYVEQVRKSVYARMIAERKQMAEKFRSEGEGEARKIEGEKEKDLKKITSEAYMKAQEIKGKADAEATHIYAEAFGKDPEFYSFVKTLDVYKNIMDKDSTLVLSTDSDFLMYLKEYKPSKPEKTR
ncbi:MAG: protease modulator HflC [Deltaproteobacteria bacterium]|nr:protease modulator HflC [Deltaproteobacteria bacterium]MBW1931033.1 protease modulator HflC [Deltaproteobacteria bacterium]MBW2026133.1 protease modulator HflC [Deltaproteobacteria bacterium]MBW2126872.1 protease modulator HflC [Deltaproteobacteria bacterium]RLB22383.1 MAG: protease modulator HflC [Deltaproteobacteria bacterium]